MTTGFYKRRAHLSRDPVRTRASNFGVLNLRSATVSRECGFACRRQLRPVCNGCVLNPLAHHLRRRSIASVQSAHRLELEHPIRGMSAGLQDSTALMP